jgi:hypothetical protein
LPAKRSPVPGTSISFETWLVLLPVTGTGEHGAFSNHEKEDFRRSEFIRDCVSKNIRE